MTALGDQAQRAAREYGEDHPVGGRIFATTENAFEAAVGGGGEVAYNHAIYLVTQRGNFTAYGASYPATSDAPLPTGRVLYFGVDKDTGDTVFVGLLHHPLDLSGIGPSVPLGVRS